MQINIKNLNMTFDDQIVLDNVNYSQDIKTLAIIGSSGGGKSTLLRIVAGLLTPISGSVKLDDLTFEKNNAVNYRRQLGYVFQNGGLFSHMTALKNITMPLIKVHDYDPKEAEKTAEGLLKRFNLYEERNKYPAELSGGERQRIAIIRAIASKPRLLLLDEPTSALDPIYTNEVLNLVNELREDGVHFIIVTHELGFAKKACEDLIFVDNSKIVECGKSKDIFANPKTPELKNFLAHVLEWNA